MASLRKESAGEVERVIEKLAHSKHVDLRWLTKREIESYRRSLDYLHNARRLSLLEISQRMERSFTFVWGLCNRLGVNVRSTAEANRLSAQKRSKHQLTSYLGSEHEKAYLMGFAEGDLDVRRASGLAIMASSTTTHPAFASLFKTLFLAYGPVYQYPILDRISGYRWKVAARLDYSFEFILPESRKAYPRWEVGADNFFAWLAGIVDADGSVNVVRSGGYGRIGLAVSNQDRRLLSHIRRELSVAGFHPTGPYVSALRGQVTPGYDIRYNKDMLVLCVQRQAEVLGLLSLLPLKHDEKARRKKLAASCIPRTKWRDLEAKTRAVQEAIRKEVAAFVKEAEFAYKNRGLGEPI